MLRKMMIASATAGLIAAGALATATAASAGPTAGVTFGGPGWSVGMNMGYHPPGRPHIRPVRVCEPVFKRIFWWKHGHRHSRLIKVGEKCHWVFPRPDYAGPFPPHPMPHPGPGPGWPMPRPY
jgi:hypothetical protein